MIIDVLDIPIKISSKPGLIKQLSEAKDLAKKLKQQQITLEVRYMGQPVLKLGTKCKSKTCKNCNLEWRYRDIRPKKLKKTFRCFLVTESKWDYKIILKL